MLAPERPNIRILYGYRTQSCLCFLKEGRGKAEGEEERERGYKKAQYDIRNRAHKNDEA